MTIRETHCKRSPVKRNLEAEMNKALGDAKRLRRRIWRLLAGAHDKLAARR